MDLVLQAVLNMNNFKITSTFKLVFYTVVGLTIFSGGTAFFLASQDHLSEHQNRVFETCSTTWQMGTGAIIGLLGGKATNYLRQVDEEKGE